mmetsp:Transcript_18292/g.27712  ORF Transcript_18292/g.27712 Transcript_18292/m.27712 type:complete len:305 (+) Transcript_18292:153-1067(+)
MVSIKSSDKSRAASRIILTGRKLAALLALLVSSPFILYSRLGEKKERVDGIFVVSLQGSTGADDRNEGRLDAFKEKWRRSCGGATPPIYHCPGVIDARRGYGLTISWLRCLERAKQMDLEVNVIFEDDARLFERPESLSFCDAEKRRSTLWSGLPEDAFVTFLGGHDWKYRNADEEEGGTTNDVVPNSLASDFIIRFQETSFFFRTYGFAVSRHGLDLLLETIRGDVANGWRDEDGVLHTEFLSPEKSWYRVARDRGKKMYAAHPLIVWHEGGFSNTWKKDRGSITGEEVNDVGGGIRGVALGG